MVLVAPHSHNVAPYVHPYFLCLHDLWVPHSGLIRNKSCKDRQAAVRWTEGTKLPVSLMNELVEGAEERPRSFWPNSACVYLSSVQSSLPDQENTHPHSQMYTHTSCQCARSNILQYKGSKNRPKKWKGMPCLVFNLENTKGVLSSEGFYSHIKPKAESWI